MTVARGLPPTRRVAGDEQRAVAAVPAPAATAWRWHALAALLYVGAASWALRVVLPAPGELLPIEVRTAPQMMQLARYDASMVLSVVIRNADTLLRAPTELLELGQCFPLRRSHTLGEHMFGEGVLAALPYLLTADPVLTYNALLFLSIWIAGMAMYAFVFDLLRRPGPALVAGLVFALTPDRMADVIHPYVHGDHWTPLAALCLRRLFARGGAWATLGATAFCSLALLESFYSVVASGVVLGTYAIHLAWAYRSVLLRRVPLLLGVLAVLAGVAWLVFAPYLETQELFGGLGGRGARLRRWWMLPLTQVAVALAAVAILDRLRGPRPRDGDDPRWAFVVAALVSLWVAVPAVPLPGFSLPSPVVLLAEVVPGFDAVRAPGAMGLGAWLAVAVLAGFGTLALTERLATPARAAVTLVLLAALLAERGVPSLSMALLRQDLRIEAWSPRPDEEELWLLRATQGPILFLPIATSGAKGLAAADYLRLTSFATRPTSACYNSFGSPLVPFVAALGEALPAPGAADALHALGFRTVVVDRPAFWRADLARFEAGLAQQRQPRLIPVGRTDRLSVFQLRGRPTARRSLASLAVWRRGVVGADGAQAASAGRPVDLRLRIANRGGAPFVHPEPLLPTEVLLRWSTGGRTVEEQRRRVLLPLALLPGEERTLSLGVVAPAVRGVHEVTLHPASAPRTVLAAERVDVR